MTVIVERDESTVELFHTALGDKCVVLETIEQLPGHLQSSPHEYAVVLGPSVDAAAATAFAERSRISRPSLGVVLVRNRVDSGVLAAALRTGMRDVVETRDLTRLTDAVRLAYGVWQAMTGDDIDETAAGPRPTGRLVTVFSTKGGVGKSTVSTNLATALSSQGKRVCLVDLDVQSGDVAIMLQLYPHRTLADLHGMGAGIDPTAVDSLLTVHSEGLSVLVAPVQIGAAQVPPDAVNQVLQVLKTMFEVVVVDTSGSFDDYALHAFDHSELLLLVGTLDIPALKSMKVAIETLDLLNLPRPRWRLVLNRADAKVGLSVGDFEQALGLEVSTSIPSSIEVPKSINRGESIVLSNPRHAVSQSILAMARSLVAPLDNEGEPEHPSHVDDSRRSLLRRKVR